MIKSKSGEAYIADRLQENINRGRQSESSAAQAERAGADGARHRRRASGPRRGHTERQAAGILGSRQNPTGGVSYREQVFMAISMESDVSSAARSLEQIQSDVWLAAQSLDKIEPDVKSAMQSLQEIEAHSRAAVCSLEGIHGATERSVAEIEVFAATTGRSIDMGIENANGYLRNIQDHARFVNAGVMLRIQIVLLALILWRVW
jgi:hypothetical protein